MGSVLPVEIMDVVIDQLHSDPRMLGICGMVCSEWLIRSRYHIFSTVQLWPWRVRRFFELSHSERCTFTNYVNCIELDDAQARGGAQRMVADEFMFHEIISSSSISRFSHIESLRIRNVDWTLLPPFDQDLIRKRLATFTKLRSLEFDDVMFHDLREIAHITTLFPSLSHLVADVRFSKYMEYTTASATTLALPNYLRVLRLGTDDAIPVLLSSTLKGLRLNSLILDDVKFWHLQYIGSALQNIGSSLRHFEINFSRTEGLWVNSNDFTLLDLTHQTRLQSLQLTGAFLVSQSPTSLLEVDIPSLLSTIPSPHNMKELTLGLTVELKSAFEMLNWSALKRAFLMIPRCQLNLDIVTPTDRDAGDFINIVKEFFNAELESLRKQGRLFISISGGVMCS